MEVDFDLLKQFKYFHNLFGFGVLFFLSPIFNFIVVNFLLDFDDLLIDPLSILLGRLFKVFSTALDFINKAVNGFNFLN